MKRIYFLRHAKSAWDSDAASDHERPLAPRGVAAAGTIGRFLAAVGQVPDAIVTSSALRARSTVELASEAGGWDVEVQIGPDLYGASPDRLLHEVRRQPQGASRLLLVGHQPTWSETVGLFVGQAEVKMVTAALARVDLWSEQWTDADFGRGVLAWLVTPKVLQRGLGI
ncbi:MAG: histidine phosphatase family protein [Deltaproteobacteria bacterium]|nr:histidine phosphatase family protein [Deltaproteobacteria bacterium]